MSTYEHFHDTLQKIKTQNEAAPIVAVLIQEHHIDATKNAELNAEAEARAKYGLLYVQAHKPRNEGKGGTAIVMPIDRIELKQGENVDTAIARIKSTTTTTADGRITTLRTLLHGHEVTVASAYAPVQSDQRAAFYTHALQRAINDKTILGIDANCVPDPQIDEIVHGGQPPPNDGATELRQITRDKDLADIVRETQANKSYYTNHTKISHDRVTRRRIDQVYTPHIDAVIFKHGDKQKDFLRRTQYGHDMVNVQVSVVLPPRGKDLETIREDIFDSEEFNTEIAALIKGMMADINPQNGEWRDAWEQVKTAVYQRGLAATENLRQKEWTEIEDIDTMITMLNDDIKRGTAGVATHEARADLERDRARKKNDQRSLHDRIEKDALHKGEQHDVNTAAFHRRWTPKNSAQWIEELMRADWTNPSSPQPCQDGPATETDHKKIAETFTEYSKPLFAKKPIDPEAKRKALQSLRNGKRVLEPTKAACDAEITADEIEHVSAYLPTRKSPGPDRLPNKFYKVLSTVTSPILAKVYNEARSEGSLPISMREGLISMLYKKGSREDPRNYRPITLLNNDYKILMRILTQRMNKAVVQWVSECQNGFVPDAFIAENTMRLQILQDIIEDEDREAIFIFFDMEKAFDRCSWEFLKAGLSELNFGQGFIDYVSLAYSHDTPPTRQLHINGYLGPSFPLGSGVAQGCPLSPLLFLVIAEPLARLINQNKDIVGIETKSKTAQGNKCAYHKISQFADDSTLMLLRTDVTAALAMLAIWCAATSMKENTSKREVLLLGTARERDAAGQLLTPLPPEIDPNTIPKDGDTIRTLGVPMGNDFSLLAWWRKKYTQVKTRISRWSGLGSLSLVGRNILVQSIVYGCLRYWFFSLPTPEEIIVDVEKDVKQLLWSAMPEFDANEEGTSKRSKRYMTEPASHLPQKQGGGGIMHIGSHIKAFQAQWIIKYVDPRRSPWKDALDHWILPAHPSDDKWATALGRGVLLTPGGLERAALIPVRSAYIKGCFEAFAELEVKQDTSIADHRIQGEPLCRNNRFTVGNVSYEAEWKLAKDPLTTDRLSDLMASSGQPFTFAQWKQFVRDCNMPPQWTQERRRNVADVRRSVPSEVMDALKQPPPPLKEGEIVYIRHTTTGRYMYARSKSGSYTKVKLDTSGYPHETDTVLTQAEVASVTRVAVWRALNKHYTEPYRGDDGHAEPEERDAVIGPTTTAFPLNDGWYIGDEPKKPNGKDRRLSELTIHEITQFFTGRITEGVRPNCEKNWNVTKAGAQRLQRIISDGTWRTIWRSIGTPLSDPTEEKNWRRLLHRATDARNRHPGKCHACRLHCGEPDESMLHMVTCPNQELRAYWRRVDEFRIAVLGGVTGSWIFPESVIFGITNRGKIMGETTRAWLRHAVRWWYAALTHIDKQGGVFSAVETLERALHGFRGAVIRWAMSIRAHYVARKFTKLTGIVAEDERAKHNKLISIEKNGQYHLSPTFTAAIGQVEQEARTEQQRRQQARDQRQQQRPRHQ